MSFSCEIGRWEKGAKPKDFPLLPIKIQIQGKIFEDHSVFQSYEVSFDWSPLPIAFGTRPKVAIGQGSQSAKIKHNTKWLLIHPIYRPPLPRVVVPNLRGVQEAQKTCRVGANSRHFFHFHQRQWECTQSHPMSMQQKGIWKNRAFRLVISALICNDVCK